MSVIKSVWFSNTEILNSINNLYLNNKGFDLDPTFSKGVFYKDFPRPKYISDLTPKFNYVEQSDCTKLKFESNSLESICFDPPFVHGSAGQRKNNINSIRFTIMPNHNSVIDLYKNSLIEFHRVLKKKGILAFKCQDFTDAKTYWNHIHVHNMSENIGYEVVDLFILLSKNRIYNPNVKQRHSRKFHCYWYVLKKK